MLQFVLPLLLAVPPAGDDIVVVRVDQGAPGNRLSLAVHGPIAPASGQLSALEASDVKFFKAGGQKPVKAVFSADADGDGTDEIFTLRQRKGQGGKYRLYAYAAPTEMFGDVGNLIASSKKNDLGSAEMFGKIISIDAIDVDGDDVDEVMILRQVQNGTQRLEIRTLPTKKNKGVSDPIGSFLEFGQDKFDDVMSVAGVDVDADAIEEIAVIRKVAMAGTRLEIYRAPSSPGDVVGAPLISAPDSGFGKSVTVHGVDLDSDGVDEIALLRSFGSNIQTLTVHPLPSSEILGSMPLPVFTHDAIGAQSQGGEVFSFLTLRGFSNKSSSNNEFSENALVGDFTCTLNHAVFFGYSLAETVTVGPIDGLKGVVDGEGFKIELLDDQDLGGDVDIFNKLVNFETTTIEVPDPSFGGTLSIVFMPGLVMSSSAMTEIRGSYSGFSSGPFGMIPVFDGKYAFRKVDD